jgi:hypothetical protein
MASYRFEICFITARETWNVRSLCRIGSIKSVVGELEKCKLDLVGVQEVRWGRGQISNGQQLYIFLCKREY